MESLLNILLLTMGLAGAFFILVAVGALVAVCIEFLKD